MIARHPYRSKIDLSDGYHQIRIFPPHEQYTAFSTPKGVYRSRVMQQGDCNAPATFMNVMTTIFSKQLGVSVFIYIDDIFIYSATLKDHHQHIREVLSLLRKHSFYASKDKSEFLPQELHILGHIITQKGISPEPKKITGVQDFPRPRNRKQLQSFISKA